MYEGNVQSLHRLVRLLLDTLTVILQKKREIVGEFFFSSSVNAILSILLKYQEMDMQIRPLAGQN